MVNYDKVKAVKKVKGEDFGKLHRQSVSGLMDRQLIADISGRSVREIDSKNNSVKTPVKQTYAVMRCSAERRLNGYC
jgi:hypothetical protein